MPAVAEAPKRIHPAKLGKYNLKPSKAPCPEKRINPPKLDPTLAPPEQFMQLSGDHALAHLVKMLSYPLPASVHRSIALETALEKIQSRARQAWGMDDGPSSLTLNVAVMSDAAIQPQERIPERISSSQVVDVQQVESDALSECVDGGGI